MKVFSPMPRGSGAIIIHEMIADQLSDYHVFSYNPYLTVFPPLLKWFTPRPTADLLHTTPDHAIFFRQENQPLVITFHNFVVGPANEMAFRTARMVSENPGRSCNPVVLHGGVGLGKTHLINAIKSSGVVIEGPPRALQAEVATSDSESGASRSDAEIGERLAPVVCISMFP